VDLKLEDVPFDFGWNLVLFEFVEEDLVTKVGQRPSEVPIEVIEVNDGSSMSEDNSDELYLTA